MIDKKYNEKKRKVDAIQEEYKRSKQGNIVTNMCESVQ